MKAAAQIIKGFHDLFPYVHEFWIEHLRKSLLAEEDSKAYLETITRLVSNFSVFRRTACLEPSQELFSLNDDAVSPSEIEAGSIPSETSNGLPSDLPEPLPHYLKFRAGGSETEQKLCTQLGKLRRSLFLLFSY